MSAFAPRRQARSKPAARPRSVGGAHAADQGATAGMPLFLLRAPPGEDARSEKPESDLVVQRKEAGNGPATNDGMPLFLRGPVQAAATSPVTVQRQTAGEGTSPVEPSAEPSPEAAASGTSGTSAAVSAPSLIVPDGVPLGPGQLGRSEFLALVRPAVVSTADEAQGPIESPGACPYIDRWFAMHQTTEAATLDRMAKRYSGLRTPASASDYVAPICARLRLGIEAWRSGQSVAAELGDAGFPGDEPPPADAPEGDGATPANGTTPAASPAAAGAPAGAAAVQAKSASGGRSGVAGDPSAIAAKLGPGEPLGGASARVAEAFGDSFPEVRVHTGANANGLAQAMDARAFTVGKHVAFADGEYAPGTPVGDALVAHELAHVQQQRGAGTAEVATAAGHGEAELDADRTAGSVLSRLYGAGANVLGALTGNARAAAKSGLSLRRCDKTRPSPSAVSSAAPPAASSAAPPAVSSAAGADLRADPSGGGSATVPDAALARELGFELDPGSRPGPPPAPGGPTPARIPWDGADGAPGFVAKRAKMKAELFHAYDAYLRFFLPATKSALTNPRVSITAPASAPGATGPAPTGVVDIANQARAVLEARYGTSMDAAAQTSSQISGREARTATGPGQNIFDAYNAADRSASTQTPDLAPGVAWWLLENDAPGAAGAAGTRPFATEIVAKHHYSAGDPGAEQFRWDVANEYAGLSTLAPNNKKQLIDYRLTGWSEGGTTAAGVAALTLQSQFSPGADPHRSELAARWEIFKTATHESLHLRTHPAFDAADLGRGTMKEGFTEMFTVATLNTDVLPRVRSGALEPLRQTVEGSLSPSVRDNTLITNADTPPQYLPHRQAAERIRDGGTPAGGTAHAGVGEAGVRAAYFEGHVEFLGLTPSGGQRSGLPAAGARSAFAIPAGIVGLDDLSRRTGVPRTTIEADNPGITDALPPTAVLIGCREQLVVAVGAAAETRANIAAQNGVSEADLVRANPGIPLDAATNAWPALTAGQKILIPAH